LLKKKKLQFFFFQRQDDIKIGRPTTQYINSKPYKKYFVKTKNKTKKKNKKKTSVHLPLATVNMGAYPVLTKFDGRRDFHPFTLQRDPLVRQSFLCAFVYDYLIS
jgi:hypothetical protein